MKRPDLLRELFRDQRIDSSLANGTQFGIKHRKIMRHCTGIPVITFLLLPLLLSECVTTAYGQETSTTAEPTTPTTPMPTLQVGDPAPQLSVDQWIKGEPVKEYSGKNIYVIEMWATWCSPCLKAMPHLHELASKHAKDGLVVVALTTGDEANTSDAVEKFVQEKGREYNFHFAFSVGHANRTNFMEASGQNGIPCSFVIDRQGKIAFIGQPHDLDYVLGRMVKGQWRGKEDADELKRMNESVIGISTLVQSDPEKALEITRHIRKVNPQRTKSLDFAYAEVLTLTHNKMFDEAKAAIETTIAADSQKSEWGQVALLCASLASPQTNPKRVHRDYALQKMAEAEKHLKDDWQNLLKVSMAYQMAGEQTKYKACMNRVIEICPDAEIKASLRLLTKLSNPA
jgi:thiol-disulfide isomerase/thioredoxin